MYDGMQWFFMIFSAVLNYISLSGIIVAQQSDRQAIVQMMLQTTFFYAFIFDLFIFDDSFAMFELLGTFVIIGSIVPTLVYQAVIEKKKTEPKTEEPEYEELTEGTDQKSIKWKEDIRVIQDIDIDGSYD